MRAGAERYPLLVPAGVTLLAVCHVLTLDGQAIARGSWTEIVGLLVGYMVLGVGVYRGIFGSSSRVVRGVVAPRKESDPQATLAPAAAEPTGVSTAMLTDFERWLSESGDAESLWGAFDQHVRESLATHVQAGRVRCYRLMSPHGTLRPLGRAHGAADVTPSESPLLTHVGMTGVEFVSGDGEVGPSIAELARVESERWDWVFRIDPGGAATGVIAVAMGEGRVAPPRALREASAALIAIQWRCVAAIEQLRLAKRTDKASGVMTRADFFEAAEEAVRDATSLREPIVAIALVIEGLRRLDDSGQWSQRDRLVSEIGGALSRRTRRDDVLGRFADDRFVILLRRMDMTLGRLIAEKNRSAAESLAVAAVGEGHGLRFRVGLAGGDLEPVELGSLLVAAFDAAESARREGLLVCAGARDALVGAAP